MAARARGSDAIETAQLPPLRQQARWLAIECAPAIRPPRCARSGKFRASLLRRQCLQSKPKAPAWPALPCIAAPTAVPSIQAQSACVARAAAAKVACQHCLLSRRKIRIAERSRAKRQCFAGNFSAPRRAAAEAICSRAGSQPLQLSARSAGGSSIVAQLSAAALATPALIAASGCHARIAAPP